MSDKLTKFEQQLAGLCPSSGLDQDKLIFEAGQANALSQQVADVRGSSLRWWKLAATVTSVLAVAATLALATTVEQLNQSRQREVVLRQVLAAPASTAVVADRPALDSDEVVSPVVLAKITHAKNSQFSMRRQALTNGAIANRQRKDHRASQAISFGETRRLLAMGGESRVGLRRIETLRPQ